MQYGGGYDGEGQITESPNLDPGQGKRVLKVGGQGNSPEEKAIQELQDG